MSSSRERASLLHSQLILTPTATCVTHSCLVKGCQAAILHCVTVYICTCTSRNISDRQVKSETWQMNTTRHTRFVRVSLYKMSGMASSSSPLPPVPDGPAPNPSKSSFVFRSLANLATWAIKIQHHIAIQMIICGLSQC